MIRFGLLVVVSTAAIAMYGEPTITLSGADGDISQPNNTVQGENRECNCDDCPVRLVISENRLECPTIGVDLGIIDDDPYEGEPSKYILGMGVDADCVARRKGTAAWTTQRNSAMSDLQFRKTHESSLLRYIWDMSNDPAIVPTNFKKFVVVAVTHRSLGLLYHANPKPYPETVCQKGFNLDYNYIARSLCDKNLPLIIVVGGDTAWSWERWANKINAKYPDCHEIQVVSIPGREDARQGGAVVATYEERVMEAVKLEIYRQLTSSTSSVRDKFPRCRFSSIPLCPSTQILHVALQRTPSYQHPFDVHRGTFPDIRRHDVEKACYVEQRNEMGGKWSNQIVGWQSKNVTDWLLYRVVLNYSGALDGEVPADWEGIVSFSRNAQRAMVITIPSVPSKFYTLLPAPEHDIDEIYLQGLVGKIEPDFICKRYFQYTWDHFFYGLWHDSQMVVVLVPGTKAQLDILVAVRDQIQVEQMKNRMFISPSSCGDCLDELYKYYKETLPLTFGSCRPELFP